MPPEESKAPDIPQPVTEAQSPASESPAPEPFQIVPPPNPVPVETVPTPPEVPVEVKTAQEPAPTAQTPPNEPFDSLPQESEQVAQGKPTPATSFPSEVPMREPLSTSQPSAPASVIAPAMNLLRDLAVKARAVIQSRKRKKLEKIMEVVNAKGEITNDQVEKLLHVSDATATRYLAQLKKEGKLKQEGKTGKSVKYAKV